MCVCKQTFFGVVVKGKLFFFVCSFRGGGHLFLTTKYAPQPFGSKGDQGPLHAGIPVRPFYAWAFSSIEGRMRVFKQGLVGVIKHCSFRALNGSAELADLFPCSFCFNVLAPISGFSFFPWACVEVCVWCIWGHYRFHPTQFASHQTSDRP